MKSSQVYGLAALIIAIMSTTQEGWASLLQQVLSLVFLVFCAAVADVERKQRVGL